MTSFELSMKGVLKYLQVELENFQSRKQDKYSVFLHGTGNYFVCQAEKRNTQTLFVVVSCKIELFLIKLDCYTGMTLYPLIRYNTVSVLHGYLLER